MLLTGLKRSKNKEKKIEKVLEESFLLFTVVEWGNA